MSDVSPPPFLKADGSSHQSKGALALQTIAIIALLFGLLARFVARPHAPLWLDEAASGAIVIQPTFSAFWQMVRWEVSSPLYFLILRPWAELFGFSNEALRAPSLIFSLMAPLSIALWPVPRLTRTERLVWAALAALWLPGAGFAQDARCYALVLLLSTLQTLAFFDTLYELTFKRGMLWIGFGSLAVAAHYDAAFLAIGQALVLLSLKRTQALKLWPGVFLASPVFALIAWQAPEMIRYMRPDTTWYKVETARGVISNVTYLFNWPWPLGALCWFLVSVIVCVPAVAFLLFDRRRGKRIALPLRLSVPISVVAASLLGAALFIGLSMVRPMMTNRYLAPFEPGCALGLTLLVGTATSRARYLALGTITGLYVGVAVIWIALGATHRDSVIDYFNYQSASDFLMKSRVQRVVFTWDNPNAKVMHPEEIAAFGKFFFQRAGVSVDVIPIQLRENDDPNIVMPKLAASSGASFVWMYDSWVNNTAGRRYPVDLNRIGAKWSCQLSGKLTIHVVVCTPVVSLEGQL